MLEGRNRDKLHSILLQKEWHQGKTHLFDFVVFKNYDGSHTAKAIPREVYKKLFTQSV